MDIIENEDCANNGSLSKKERNNYVGVSEMIESTDVPISQLQQRSSIEHTSNTGIGSGLMQRPSQQTKIHQNHILGPKSTNPPNSQYTLSPLQNIPNNQRPIFRLLQSFRLQQYAKTFVDQGYGDDIYQLTMITHRKRQEIMDSIDLLPGHKLRMTELFRRIENVYPRQNVQKTIDNAIRVSSRQSASALSTSLNSGTQEPSQMQQLQQNMNQTSTTMAMEKAQIARQSVNTAQSTATVMGQLGSISTVLPLLQTQQVQLSSSQKRDGSCSGIPPPTNFPKRVSPQINHTRSPPNSQSKNNRRSQAESLLRQFNQLDQGTRAAINDSFLQNIRQGKSQATTVQDALKEFYGKDTQAKQIVINRIFAHPVSNSIQKSGAASKNLIPTGRTGLSSDGGFGVQRFHKAQKVSTNMTDKLRSQISSQESTTTGTRTTNQLQTRQNLRSEIQPPRHTKPKNSNSSSESRNAIIGQPYRIKANQPATRSKNPSSSSERKDNSTFGSLNAPNTTKNNSKLLAPLGKPSRHQLQTDAKKQRQTSLGRLQLQQNSNFMIAPNNSQSASAQKQQESRLSRRTSLQGRAASEQRNIEKTAAQHAAIKRVQLHRQRSTKRQITIDNQNIDEQQKIIKSAAKPPITTSQNNNQGGTLIPRPATNPHHQMLAAKQRHQNQQANSARRHISKDRLATAINVNPSNSRPQNMSQATTGLEDGDAVQSSHDRLRLLRRASSQGHSSRDQPGQQLSRRSRDSNAGPSNGMGAANNIAEPVSQSAVFTEFKMITSPDQLTELQSRPTALPGISTATVKKVNQKGEELNVSFKSTNAVHPASATGKPPMSTSKRSGVSSKASESVKTVQSVHNSPDKAQVGNRMTNESPRRPFVLEPIQNPPTVVIKPVHTNSKSQLEEVPVTPPMQVEEKSINQEEKKELWTPLLDKSEKLEAQEYGHSFGSKKVAMGPGFMNLRFMCHCLARAIKRHLEFSNGEHWFLQDLQKQEDDIDLEFSYQLPNDLKLTLNPKGVRVNTEDDDDDASAFLREDDSPVKDIGNVNIDIEAARKISNSKDSSRKQSTGLGEPEPELIPSPSDQQDRLSAFVNNDNQYSNNRPANNSTAAVNDDEQIAEELDDEETYSQDDFHNPEEGDPEDQSIKEIRRDELSKLVYQKDEKRLTAYLMNQHKVNQLEYQLKSKDKQIEQLTRLVQHDGTARSEVMAIQGTNGNGKSQQSDADSDGYFDKIGGVKMDRAEWIMAQIDLDPIESRGSMEMSTTKFQSLKGKRFINSEAGAVGGFLEDSRQSPSGNAAAIAILEKQQNKKKSDKSYESAFVDVSEDKMRDFAMSQLKHFDARMSYDKLEFDEDKFIPMPSEKYIADYCKYVTIACKMENEIPIVCLVYLEKLLLTTGILLNKWNWRRLVLICLCLASKIWDDDSLENVHFPKVMSDVTNFEINKLEQLFLEFIDYKLVIKGAAYAKYYFILRSMAEDLHKENSASVASISPFENARRNKANKEEWAEFPLRAPISAGKMLELQRQEAKAEVYLKERHEREFLNAYIGHKPGSRKDQTRHPSLLLDRTM